MHQMNTNNYVNTLKSKPRHQMNTINYVNTLKPQTKAPNEYH